MSKIRDRLKSEVWFPTRGLSVFVSYCEGHGMDVEEISDEELDEMWAKFQLEATDRAIHEVSMRHGKGTITGRKFGLPEWVVKCM